MKQDNFNTLGLVALLLLGSSAAYSQQKVHVGDDGIIIPAEQSVHAKAGQKVAWVRSTGSGKPWFVQFAGDTPCKEGKALGSASKKTCTINAACKAAGDAGCKSYKYSSATGPTAPMHDPEIIVDP